MYVQLKLMSVVQMLWTENSIKNTSYCPSRCEELTATVCEV
jgi:hypothetical protein